MYHGESHVCCLRFNMADSLSTESIDKVNEFSYAISWLCHDCSSCPGGATTDPRVAFDTLITLTALGKIGGTLLTPYEYYKIVQRWCTWPEEAHDRDLPPLALLICVYVDPRAFDLHLG